ncbi:hypothetical protein PIB30_096966, partial [Stylosanthes scabra]|nr:hypothetical protein [Stylosanthes scabra]
DVTPHTIHCPLFPLYSYFLPKTMNINDFIVVNLYPNGENGRDTDGIWFRPTSPLVFQMQPVNTLEELKSVILRNMGLSAAC